MMDDASLGSYIAAELREVQQLIADKNTNSVMDLLIFCFALLLLFLWRHYRRNRQALASRRGIALVVGGWGSRGKSGTERLKAALFNALGHSLLSKTTGCEPVLLHGHRYGKLEEIPLHRPFQKATIWEQLDVVQLAEQLKVDVFLWECMGLDPDYVQIMQREWMQDDISTITNTYPDHEDIQGPSGLDVAKSISHFIGRNSQLLTAEELMLPILRQRCQASGTELSSLDLRQLNALTADVTQRFPYAEHPHNIALILALARKLGVHQDFALKEMADRVKPDIGVLKTYPTARLARCELEFTNGFSANEKFACVSNWKRLGFDQFSLETHPAVWLTVLINNREDRVFRSQVFADVMVEDLEVDSFYLVGTNLNGFTRAYSRGVDTFIAALDLSSWPAVWRNFSTLRRRLRVARDTTQLGLRLQPGCPDWDARLLLDALSPQLPSGDVRASTSHFGPAELLSAQQKSMLASFVNWTRFESEGKASEQGQEPHGPFAKQLRLLLQAEFMLKLQVVPESVQSDAERLIHYIADATPVGMLNKMQGIQNIKGVGLRWLEAWEEYEGLHREVSRLPMHEQSERTLELLRDERLQRALSHGLLRDLRLAQGLSLDSLSAGTAAAPAARHELVSPAFSFRAWQGCRQAMQALAQPTSEYRKTRLIQSIYKKFSSRLLDAGAAREQIRQIQES